MTSDVNTLADRLVPFLMDAARRKATITYAELARAAAVTPPHTIHKTVEALEILMARDAALGQPLLASVAVSAKRRGFPAPGFFQAARALGLYFGPDRGPQAETFHAMALEQAWETYGPRSQSDHK